jgi:hypothetical protein
MTAHEAKRGLKARAIHELVRFGEDYRNFVIAGARASELTTKLALPWTCRIISRQ